MPERAPLHILLVEDDDVAAESVQRSLRQAGVHLPVIWATDGQDALDILQLRRPDKAVPRPRLILLDLNMPRMNGFEFLSALRKDEALRDEVVFILTTSDDDSDRSRAYHAHVAGYMVKSAVGPQFSRLVQLLQGYACAVKLP